MVLESKSGNWKYLPEKWTQLPEYDEAGKQEAICIETSNHDFFVEDHKKVLLSNESKPSCLKWTRTKDVGGYFALKTNLNNIGHFLTVQNPENLTVHGKDFLNKYDSQVLELMS